jgi:uncharacterized protein with von Willebrand factor type A (vWA) domain
MNFHFEPPLGFPVSVLLIMAVLGAAIFLAVRGWRTGTNKAVIVLRLISFSLLAVLFLNPVRMAQSVRREKPVFVVLLDSSHSMNTPDAANGTRWQTTQAAVLRDTRLLASLRTRFDVQFFAFGRQAQQRTPQQLSAQPQAAEYETRIADALTHISALGQPSASEGTVPTVGGILLVSDGRDNGTADPLQAARQCRARGLPVFTLTLGKTFEEPDAELVTPKPQVFAAPNQSVTLSAELRNSGMTSQNATRSS